MNEFALYLVLGFEHLLDISAPDHIIFILMLALPYDLKDWKKMFWLATAFTLGHSFTLSIAIFTDVQPNFIAWIEILIALSILLTAIFNFFQWNSNKNLYILVVIFGFIHGYGFSGLLKSLLQNMEFSIWTTLLPFNIGLEIAQLIWISIILIFNYYVHYPTKIKNVIYLITFCIGVYWTFQRLTF